MKNFNIYVDELPKGCEDCYCCNYCMDYGISCKITTRELNFGIEWEKRPTDCPLKPLTDRLTEERKKVISEIWQEFEQRLKGKTKDMSIIQVCLMINSVLDQIERGE